MKVLLVNIPFIKFDESGEIHTGPNSGSRWPWTLPGISEYACFPFLLGYAVRYLRHHGIEADFYDGVALGHWDYEIVRKSIRDADADILVFDTATPLYPMIREFGEWVKRETSSRVVLVGPHMQAYAREAIEESWVDHCVIGEYEKPLLAIARDPEGAEKIYDFDLLDDINLLGGENFLPERQYGVLHRYWDPSMKTARVQLQINTSRGCPFKCTYCQWPKVMNNGKYRNRRPELVIDEIETVVREYREFTGGIGAAARLKGLGRSVGLGVEQGIRAARGKQSYKRGVRNVARTYSEGDGTSEIGSIFFDDDTWNLGSKRIKELCAGLARIGLPWTMMGRTDVSSPELYDLMVDSGCVGMRFGVETFDQKLLDNVKKKMDGQRNYDMVKYLITNHSGMEFHFTTMKNLPGETDADWQEDLRKLDELRELGLKRDNVVHWQNSDCVAFPGTELWEEMVEMGKGEQLRDFELYDGGKGNMRKLADAVGWLGEDYRPSWSEYSGMGAPTNLPEDTPVQKSREESDAAKQD